jgi:hypothetical protein
MSAIISYSAIAAIVVLMGICAVLVVRADTRMTRVLALTHSRWFRWVCWHSLATSRMPPPLSPDDAAWLSEQWQAAGVQRSALACRPCRCLPGMCYTILQQHEHT